MRTALRGSLRLRLIIGSAIGVVLAVVLAGLFIGNLYRIHSTERFQEELDHHLDELIAMTSVDAGGMPRVAQPLSDPLFNATGSGLYWQVDAGRGGLARSISLGKHRLAAASDSTDWRTGRIGDQILLQRSARVLDAWALAMGLSRHRAIDRAMADAVALRRRHVQFYQWLTWLFTPVYQSDSHLLPFLRDRLVGPLSRLWPVTAIQAAAVSGLIGNPLHTLGLKEGTWSAADLEFLKF